MRLSMSLIGRRECGVRGLGKRSRGSCVCTSGSQHATDRPPVGDPDRGHGGVEQQPGAYSPDRVQPGRPCGRFRGEGIEGTG